MHDKRTATFRFSESHLAISVGEIIGEHAMEVLQASQHGFMKSKLAYKCAKASTNHFAPFSSNTGVTMPSQQARATWRPCNFSSSVPFPNWSAQIQLHVLHLKLRQVWHLLTVR